MSEPRLSLFARMALAWTAFFRTIFDAEFAASVRRIPLSLPQEAEEPQPVDEPADETRPRTTFEQVPVDAALILLGLLQRDGRFIDFLEEDVAAFSDAEVGAAARVVHEGCQRALREHFTFTCIREEEEGAQVTIEDGFDAGEIRLTGRVSGSAPFRGTLQ
ncbi:MAG: DUF2760 domain-containing protein, partial [Myxococcota bacterium]